MYVHLVIVLEDLINRLLFSALYFSFGTYKDVTFSSYVRLACINTIYKYGHAWVI